MADAQVLIGKIALTEAQTSVTFSNIPPTYRDLRIVANPIGVTAALDSDYVKFNNSSSDFTNVQLYGNGSATGSNTGTSGRVSNYESTIGRPYSWIMEVMDYSAGDKFKTYLSRFNADDSGVGIFAGRWAQYVSVNTIQIYPAAGSYAIGSTFTLFGVLS